MNLNKKDIDIKDKHNTKNVNSFLKKIVKIWDNPNSNIKNINVKYLGEKIFQDSDIIESNLIFKRNNSRYLRFSLLVPVVVSRDIYEKLDNKDINNVEKFLDFYIRVISDSIVFIYNTTNPRSYIVKYKNETVGISNNIYKNNIYKVKFEIYGKNETIYFNIDDSISDIMT
ncbi:MAG: hypothetical protein KAQ94_09790 [Arcobacteraceae bacterium]|nr:hypothetical protein [Arcobacteraceae bacterium]